MDSIRIPEKSGCVIVELVLERIDISIRQLVGLYQPSSDEASVASVIRSVKELLRRIAAVESDYGRADHTYRDTYHGGIWQVDEADFNGHPDKVFSFLELHPGRRIDLLDTYITLSWVDLRQPLYSGFAATLQLFLSGEQIPDAENIEYRIVPIFIIHCYLIAHMWILVDILWPRGMFLHCTQIHGKCYPYSLSPSPCMVNSGPSVWPPPM